MTMLHSILIKTLYKNVLNYHDEIKKITIKKIFFKKDTFILFLGALKR